MKLKRYVASIGPHSGAYEHADDQQGPWTIVPKELEAEAAAAVALALNQHGIVVTEDDYLNAARLGVWLIGAKQPGTPEYEAGRLLTKFGLSVKRDQAETLAEPSASGWREMASAPKDGTPVLVFDEGAIFVSACGDDGKWIECGITVDPPPTHWQPLPPVPSPSWAQGES